MASIPVIAATYIIEDNYDSSNFASSFTFFTDTDPTNGYVTYVDQTTAENDGLFSVNGNSVYIGVDSTNIASGAGRNSVRVTSNKAYTHGLIILDLAHMPGGQCGSWPAFWMTGPDWPNNGELDIIEGVNSASTNAMTLHTSDGCSVSNTGTFSGTLLSENCYIDAAGQTTNMGCTVDTSNGQTFGTGFNAVGGGVYAAEWTSSAITLWFFPRANIPTDILNGNPDPSGWGLAIASFSGSCDLDEHVDNMQIIFDTTFCGDWAGNVWGSDSVCSSKASTCKDYVQNNPSAFVESYWSINSLKVYQDNGSSSSASTLPISASTSSATSTIASTFFISTITSLPTTLASSTATPTAITTTFTYDTFTLTATLTPAAVSTHNQATFITTIELPSTVPSSLTLVPSSSQTEPTSAAPTQTAAESPNANPWDGSSGDPSQDSHSVGWSNFWGGSRGSKRQ